MSNLHKTLRKEVLLFNKRYLESMVEYIPESGCWIWQGACDIQGYGSVYIAPKTRRVARAVWELFFGPIPVKKIICHHCDTPSCVNPKHLFIGSHADNANDFYRKNRSKQQKLSPDDRIKIRNDTRSRQEIAESYNISIAYVTGLRHAKKR